MKIAIPLAEGNLAMHFGHCEKFAIMDLDGDGAISKRIDLIPPPHAPGVLPAWLHDLGVTQIIAGGMGSRAQALFRERNIRVFVGAPFGSPEQLAAQCASGTLVDGDNVCDH